MTFFHRFTHYFVEFCRERRLRTFLKVVQKNLQHTCSKRGGGGQRPFEQQALLANDGFPYHSIIIIVIGVVLFTHASLPTFEHPYEPLDNIPPSTGFLMALRLA